MKTIPNAKEVLVQTDPDGNPYMILHIIEAELKHYDEWGDYWFCQGFVENVLDPDCSEYGSFGLNKAKTKRVW